MWIEINIIFRGCPILCLRNLNKGRRCWGLFTAKIMCRILGFLARQSKQRKLTCLNMIKTQKEFQLITIDLGQACMKTTRILPNYPSLNHLLVLKFPKPKMDKDFSTARLPSIDFLSMRKPRFALIFSKLKKMAFWKMIESSNNTEGKRC